MSYLHGSVAGSSSRLAGGLAMSAGLLIGEPLVFAPVRPRPLLAPTDVRLGGGARFRRHLNGLTTDAVNAALGGALVLIYDTITRLLVAAITSDAAGVYDYPIYAEGTTYFIYTNKAGAIEVFGGSSNQLVPT